MCTALMVVIMERCDEQMCFINLKYFRVDDSSIWGNIQVGAIIHYAFTHSIMWVGVMNYGPDKEFLEDETVGERATDIAVLASITCGNGLLSSSRLAVRLLLIPVVVLLGLLLRILQILQAL